MAYVQPLPASGTVPPGVDQVGDCGHSPLELGADPRRSGETIPLQSPRSPCAAGRCSRLGASSHDILAAPMPSTRPGVETAATTAPSPPARLVDWSHGDLASKSRMRNGKGKLEPSTWPFLSAPFAPIFRVPGFRSVFGTVPFVDTLLRGRLPTPIPPGFAPAGGSRRQGDLVHCCREIHFAGWAFQGAILKSFGSEA